MHSLGIGSKFAFQMFLYSEEMLFMQLSINKISICHISFSPLSLIRIGCRGLNFCYSSLRSINSIPTFSLGECRHSFLSQRLIEVRNERECSWQTLFGGVWKSWNFTSPLALFFKAFLKFDLLFPMNHN